MTREYKKWKNRSTNKNEQLLKNIEEYEQKKKTQQQKPKVLGQKPIKRKANSKEKTNVRS